MQLCQRNLFTRLYLIKFSFVQWPLKQRRFTRVAFVLRKSNVSWNVGRRISTTSDSLSIQSVESINCQMEMWNKEQNLNQAVNTMNKAVSQGIVPPAKCFDILLYLCNIHGKHNKLDTWYTERQKHYEGIGLGTSMTLIRSFCARGQWKAALKILQSQMKEKRLYHTRFYNPIIRAAAEAGQRDAAFQLFEEKIKRSLSVYNKESLLVPDSEMLAALIRCCYTDPPKNHTTKTPHKNNAQEIFTYLQNIGAPLSAPVIESAHDWFKHDPVNTWRWEAATVSDEGVCSACGTYLERGQPNKDFTHLGEELLRQFSTGKQLQFLNEKDNAEFQRFQKSARSCGPFDIIIDGMNVGLSGTNRRKPIFINTKQLRDLVHQFTQKGKRVLVVLQRSALQDINSSADYIAELQDLCFVDTTSNKLDDLHILYAAAFSGMQGVQVITNDMLQDHHIFFDVHLKWIYLKWTRLNCISFKIDQGQVCLSDNLFDPVVQRTENSWHFPTEDGSWICVIKEK